MNSVRWAVGKAVSCLLIVGAAANAENASNPLADHVRAANDRFKDVAVAVAEGYAPIPCASGVDGGAMGVHYVNAKYLSEEVPDIKRPQAVMYEPQPDGKMALIAVEYITGADRGRIHHVQGTGLARGPAVQFQRRAQPLRPRPVLRIACVVLERQSARRVRRHEPESDLRARPREMIGHSPDPLFATPLERRAASAHLVDPGMA